MESYIKYKFKQAVKLLDKNKDRISLFIGIIGFVSTIYALYDTKNSSRENFKLSKAVFELQERSHFLDSINDSKKQIIDSQKFEFQVSEQRKNFIYQDSINKKNLQAAVFQNKVAEQQLKFQTELYSNQLKLEEPVFSLSVDKIENEQICFRLYNDGKRDAFVKNFQFYTVTFDHDTSLMVDENIGTYLLHPNRYILFWVLKSQLHFLSKKKHSYIVFKLFFIDKLINKNNSIELFYGMHILPIKNSYSVELLAISDGQVKRIKKFLDKIPAAPKIIEN